MPATAQKVIGVLQRMKGWQSLKSLLLRQIPLDVKLRGYLQCDCDTCSLQPVCFMLSSIYIACIKENNNKIMNQIFYPIMKRLLCKFDQF